MHNNNIIITKGSEENLLQISHTTARSYVYAMHVIVDI